MLLGAARHLSENPDFGGTVVFIFQPEEEGLGGGREMVEEGPVPSASRWTRCMDCTICRAIPVGAFRTRTGAFLAASDSWAVDFHGTGGHGGAGAHLSTDATLPAASFILALQTVVSRSVPAGDTAVISVGSVMAGDPGSPNSIPARVSITGTARSYQPEIRDLLERRLTEIAHAQAASFGCKATVSYDRRYPPLITHAEQTAVCVAAATAAGRRRPC